MPQLIQHIDAIARKRQWDVLSIRFHAPESVHEYDYGHDPERQRVIRWLEEQGMAWRPCGPVASESAMLPYRGDVYADVPYDVSDTRFRTLKAYLENPDGTMRHPSVTLEYYPLALAMKNAHHDEARFWDR